MGTVGKGDRSWWGSEHTRVGKVHGMQSCLGVKLWVRQTLSQILALVLSV